MTTRNQAILKNLLLTEAAPELLAALQSMLGLHIAHHNHPIHAAARAIIARAQPAADLRAITAARLRAALGAPL
tara:strand:- start:2478 stop:2699 length:222 start_codon:yes stop_codon:yes gene_type:complete